ncbi:MAG: hypothetical protein MI866_06945 [Bacteroidales bacterium]|nr:hypothetical protein [Bacteroidales bacterium]
MKRTLFIIANLLFCLISYGQDVDPEQPEQTSEKVFQWNSFFSVDNSKVFIQQVGISNSAEVLQAGEKNLISLRQIGEGNEADFYQKGLRNIILHKELGSFNKINVTQEGMDNAYTTLRLGRGSNGAETSVTQKGNGHKALHIQLDGSKGVEVYQSGNFGYFNPVVVKTGRIGSF